MKIRDVPSHMSTAAAICAGYELAVRNVDVKLKPMFAYYRERQMKIPKKPTREMIQAGCMELKDILSETLEEWDGWDARVVNEYGPEYVKRIYEKMIESIEENGE